MSAGRAAGRAGARPTHVRAAPTGRVGNRAPGRATPRSGGARLARSPWLPASRALPALAASPWPALAARGLRCLAWTLAERVLPGALLGLAGLSKLQHAAALAADGARVAALHQGGAASLLLLAAALCAGRAPAAGPRGGLAGLALAWAGTLGLRLALAPAPPAEGAPPALLAASGALALAGWGLALWGLASLGRCFGLRPAARGLVTRGAYRLVRHPMYVGEALAALGLLLLQLTLPAALGLALWLGVQALRARAEEAALRAAFPTAYAAYAARVGAWRPARRR